MCCHLLSRHFLFCQSSVICLSFVCIWATQHDVCEIFSAAQMIVGQKSMLAYILQKWLDLVEHPATSGILHLTYYALGHTKSFPGILNSKVIWVLERRVTLPPLWVILRGRGLIFPNLSSLVVAFSNLSHVNSRYIARRRFTSCGVCGKKSS